MQDTTQGNLGAKLDTVWCVQGDGNLTFVTLDAAHEQVVIQRVAPTPADGNGTATPIPSAGSVTIKLSDLGGKAAQFQTMSNGARVLATSDFTGGSGGPSLYLTGGFITPHAFPDGQASRVLIQAVAWTMGWVPGTGPGQHDPSSLPQVYIAPPLKLQSWITSEMIPDIITPGVASQINYSAYTFTTFTSGGIAYCHQYRTATDPSSTLPVEKQYITPPYLPGDLLWCWTVPLNLNVQITSGDPVTAATVVAAGTAYKVGDVLSVTGGTGTSATLTVATITGGGSTGPIGTVTISGAGAYSAPPSNPVATGAGSISGATGATFALVYTQVTLQDSNDDSRGWGQG